MSRKIFLGCWERYLAQMICSHVAYTGPLLFFPIFSALISFNTVNESIVLISKVSQEAVCSLIGLSRILGC